ncbi:uncharacterized protein MEPE_01806 [Melanopsichium pennsylvanicum]|uniref:DUF2470 domain-containing protein n=2 Tax=Melanopsichium pennsylvanicum TaxID=63383 RepID=A0AAJ5C3Y1_9BASI|nr:conserved hypothetical protein [Melanopsichium pennsylvanicum 4]SNX83100.1 uncharacterized protein MEPE_01806 [Melanopsichium pennsylvanicum]
MAEFVSDDVAAKAEGIISHMNNDHKDSLAYLATHYGDLLQPLKPNQVLMIAIDKRHLEIVYNNQKGATPGKGMPGSKTVSVPFYPHLSGYSEVRQRLVDLSALSEKVVTSRKPDIIYKAPKLALNALVLGTVAYLALRSDALASHGLVQSLVPEGRLAQWNNLRNNTFGGPAKMDAFVKSIVRAHMVEGALMALMCYWKGASRLVAIRWALTTAALGVPSWIAFFSLNSHKRALKRAVFIDADKKKKNK